MAQRHMFGGKETELAQSAFWNGFAGLVRGDQAPHPYHHTYEKKLWNH